MELRPGRDTWRDARTNGRMHVHTHRTKTRNVFKKRQTASDLKRKKI